MLTAYLNPRSKFHKNSLLVGRARLAAELLRREQTPDGNINNPITNFNSPADLAFVVRGVCTPALLTKRAGERELFAMLEPFLRKAGEGLTKGGIHTPNHRWVVCAALAQLNEIMPDARYVRRIDQWLAEGIDIDSDGQYSERSTYVYNPITNSAFVAMAAKLRRPQLLEPVQRNLESMMYLIHPGYEVVTEFSTRQDLNQRGDMGSYWFALAYMAAHKKDGRCATLARHFAPTRASLSATMEYPELLTTTTPPAAIPENYRHVYPHNKVVRIRRGPISATVLAEGRNRFFAFRNGSAVINAVRFATAFFGRGQFIPTASNPEGTTIQLTQSLAGPYYQPLDPSRQVGPDDWSKVRRDRKQTEICKLEQSAAITEIEKGFRVRLRSHGTDDVPLAVEINFREGGTFEGVTPDGVLAGESAVYRMGSDAIRFGPGAKAHTYIQVRGAEPKLSGPSVFITGFTPFDHTLEFIAL
jgi:hypothetical protein